MNLQRGWEKGPRRNSKLPKKHLFHSRPEVLRTTFRLYKNSKSQTLETLVSLPLSIFFLLLFARKANIVCLLFIVSQTCFNKNDFFFVKQRISLFFELLDHLAIHITWPSEEDPAELCQPRPPWTFQTQRGHGRIWQSKESEANVVVTKTIATASTLTRSHATWGSVTSIGLQLSSHLPPISQTIQVRRTRHPGYCWRSKDELISKVFQWTPTRHIVMADHQLNSSALCGLRMQSRGPTRSDEQ